MGAMRVASVAVAFVTLFAGGTAFADGTKPPATGSTFTLTRQASPNAAAARARAAAGDCKSALDLFDRAIEGSIDPTLRRDRGACHEKLGNTYAAVEDYRAYLAAAPDAPDHEAVEGRLKDLEDTLPKDTVHAQASGTAVVSVGAVGAARAPTREVQKDETKSPTLESDDKNKTQSEIDEVERREVEADGSPMRRGVGFDIGAYYQAGYWARSGFGFTQAVGARLGYAFAGVSSLLLEIGYRNNRGTGTASQSGGIQLALGYEARVGLDRWSTNELLFAGLVGYEEAKQNGSGLLFRSFVPRGRVGWRHVFGRSVGLEFDADVGVAVTFAVDAPPGSQKVVVAPIIAGMVGLVIGF